MIKFIKGTIFSFGSNWVIIECNGIGYYVYFAHPEQLSLGMSVFMYTYQQFSEDSQSLFGFLDKEEADLFENLIEVKGLGCRTAMNILSKRKYEDIIKAIEMGDIAFLKAIPSLGAKTSQQIILDLKGKLVTSLQDNNIKENDDYLQAVTGLKNLGYKASEINQISKELLSFNCKSANEYLKTALKLLSKVKVK